VHLNFFLNLAVEFSMFIGREDLTKNGNTTWSLWCCRTVSKPIHLPASRWDWVSPNMPDSEFLGVVTHFFAHSFLLLLSTCCMPGIMPTIIMQRRIKTAHLWPVAPLHTDNLRATCTAQSPGTDSLSHVRIPLLRSTGSHELEEQPPCCSPP
jgi:hypothetical protein